MKRSVCAAFASLAIACMANNASADDLNKSLDDALASKPVFVKFSAVFDKTVDSRLAEAGDPVEAHLLEKLTVDDTTVAPAGARVVGHIKDVTHSRGLVKSAKAKKERFKRHASVSIVFDKIVLGPDYEIPIKGMPAEQVYFFTNEGQFKRIIIGPDGELVKTGSMDMTPLSSDAQIPIPDTLLGFANVFQIHVVPGDIVPVNATIMDDDLNLRSVDARLVGSNGSRSRSTH